MTTVSFPEHTITEILQLLEARGYTASFRIEGNTIPPGLYCGHCHHRVLPRQVTVQETWRFEGATDPDDEAVLLAFACPRCETGGTLLSAYGPNTGPVESDIIAALSRDRAADPQLTDANTDIPAKGGPP